MALEAPLLVLPFRLFIIFLQISLDKEVGEEDDEHGRHHLDEAVGPALARGGAVVAQVVVGHAHGDAADKLDELARGQVALEAGAVAHGGKGVVAVHEGVDQAVEADEGHNARGLGDGLGPHARHRDGVVEPLENRHLLALDDKNPSVNILIHLGDIE